MKQSPNALVVGSSVGADRRAARPPTSRRAHRLRPTCHGFTLIELMTAIAILLILMGLLTVAFNSTSTAWRRSERDVERFQDARATLDLLGRDLAQAIISTNIPFYGGTKGLAFVASNNDDTNYLDLAETVYILSNTVPPFILLRRTSTYRDASSVNWDFYSNLTGPTDWPTTADTTNIVCENIVRFRMEYYDAANQRYLFWNSTTQPGVWPAVQVGGLQAAALRMTNQPPAYIDVRLDVVDSRSARLLTNLSAAAVANITNQNVRSFNVYIKVPQR